jgi:hypothetical protein
MAEDSVLHLFEIDERLPFFMHCFHISSFGFLLFQQAGDGGEHDTEGCWAGAHAVKAVSLL